MPKYKTGDFVIDTSIDRGIICVWKVICYDKAKDQYTLSTEFDNSFLMKDYGNILISKRATVESATRLTGSNWKLLYGR